MRLFSRDKGSLPAGDELRAEIDRLAGENRERPRRKTERRLLALRHRAGIERLEANGHEPSHPEPDYERLPAADGLPELTPDQLTPELVRAGILRDGCVLVRGLVERGRAERFAELIDRSFAERDQFNENGRAADGYYEEFDAEPPFDVFAAQRPWIQRGGGVLAVDAPLLSAQMIDMFEAAGVQSLVEGYLGEPALISIEKTTLRKAEPHVSGAWHQDGKFMGDVRALNLWLSLSRCGDEAPGLDIVPKRLDYIVEAGDEETFLDIQVSQANAERAAGDTPILRPIFEPGDALLFDELFLHSTASDPAMPNPRYAIESWFFGGSAFPREYGPVAV